jgi:hypothetical protein
MAETGPEVFDLRCRLFFYRPESSFDPSRSDELRFVAVPDDPSVRYVLRGVMAVPIATVADHGRLLGVRHGKVTDFWPDEAQKVGLGCIPGYSHDLVRECVWIADPVPPSFVRAYWPSTDEIVA